MRDIRTCGSHTNLPFGLPRAQRSTRPRAHGGPCYGYDVHVDTHAVTVSDVKAFLRRAFYHRFGLAPDPEFIEPTTGGGAVGLRLERFDRLPELIRRLDDVR